VGDSQQTCSGDSYSQTGFNVTLSKPSAANPLGNPPLPGWTASGGLNWVGFLASVFNTSDRPIRSYNFAYGGATTDASLVTPYQPTVLSFVDQVKLFRDSIATHPSYAAWNSENALFGVWLGVNDVGNSYWLDAETERLEKIMDVYFGLLKDMYDAGARNFALLTVPRELLPRPNRRPSFHSSPPRPPRLTRGRVLRHTHTHSNHPHADDAKPERLRPRARSRRDSAVQ